MTKEEMDKLISIRVEAMFLADTISRALAIKPYTDDPIYSDKVRIEIRNMDNLIASWNSMKAMRKSNRSSYPARFWIVHKLFTGKSFPPCGSWGSLGDGPVGDWDDVLDCVAEGWPDDELPSDYDLRVWWFDITDGYVNVEAVAIKDIIRDMRERMDSNALA